MNDIEPTVQQTDSVHGTEEIPFPSHLLAEITL